MSIDDVIEHLSASRLPYIEHAEVIAESLGGSKEVVKDVSKDDQYGFKTNMYLCALIAKKLQGGE
ncbi:MAG: hypothetical protein ACRCXB_19480 [Aeromonadaceae bacterium]